MSVALLLQAVNDGKIPAADQSFALSLLAAAKSARGLSPKQAAWVPRLLARAAGGDQPREVALGPSAAGIFTLFAHAAGHGLKWPKIHLVAADETPVQFSRAGERSKYCGEIMLTDGGPFRGGRFFGRIDADGQLHASRDLTPPVRELVERFAADPAAVAAAHGHTTGGCCFCALKLTTDDSVAVGYGPVCAQKFGLPYGAKARRAAQAADVAATA